MSGRLLSILACPTFDITGAGGFIAGVRVDELDGPYTGEAGAEAARASTSGESRSALN